LKVTYYRTNEFLEENIEDLRSTHIENLRSFVNSNFKLHLKKQKIFFIIDTDKRVYLLYLFKLLNLLKTINEIIFSKKFKKKFRNKKCFSYKKHSMLILIVI